MSNGFTAILVVVDRSSKQAIFIPTHDTITSEQLAELFVIHVFSKHGVPNHVTSDRGSEFVSAFFRALGKALSMELHYTSGYHPEADGQTERVNQTLEQYIRIYCSYQQDDWSPLLPIAEFAYNNAPNASTGITPFFANKGCPEVDMKSDLARDFVVNLDELHVFLREEILLAQSRYKEQADRKRISHTRSSRSAPKYLFLLSTFALLVLLKNSQKNILVLSRSSVDLVLCLTSFKLPDYLRRIHPVFHVSQLEPVTPNPFPNRTQSPPPPIEVDGEEEYNIAEILDSKLDRRYKRCPLRYYIRWAGFEGTDDEFSWVAAYPQQTWTLITQNHFIPFSFFAALRRSLLCAFRG
ncbi:reverse transcriptase-R -integrase [Lentinula edodes]|uniref:Reverse transcriptase-R-integrase n=1 Tax=Lentinula edodes TaxID=5353 RepID=A0A1Q3EFE9_LENED|nr:reverse transcriptase-R -integrase [Lentinula edodes]